MPDNQTWVPGAVSRPSTAIVNRPRRGAMSGSAPPPMVLPPHPAAVAATPVASGPAPATGSALPELLTSQISAIDAISPGHPVFLVTLGNSATKLVIKVEDHASSIDGLDLKPMTRHNIGVINDIMGTVSAGVDSVPLSELEVAAVAAFRASPAELAMWLALVQSGQKVMLKMAHNAGFTTLGKASELSLSDKDKSRLNSLILKLRNNSKAWLSMGAITAADLFVGNNDRIDFNVGVIGNAGNMIFQEEANGSINRALGYDNLDPTASDAGFMYGRNIRAWQDVFGIHLRDVRAYGRKCQTVIQNFNARTLAPLGIAPLSPADGSSLAAGMELGRNALARKISDRMKIGQKVPSGVAARALWLGWVR